MLWVDLTPSLPFSLIGGGPEAPTDLVTSEVTHYSFRASWTGPEGPVEKYRVEYMTLSGRPQKVSTPDVHRRPVTTTNPKLLCQSPSISLPNPSITPTLGLRMEASCSKAYVL